MASISLEATITLVLGIPSLIVAVLTWWETRYSRRNAILGKSTLNDIASGVNSLMKAHKPITTMKIYFGS